MPTEGKQLPPPSPVHVFVKKGAGSGTRGGGRDPRARPFEASLEIPTLNDYARQCHADNMKWWVTADGTLIERNKGELLMLIVSEIAECMEGVRKNAMDDKLPHRKMEEVELADALIRIFDYADAYSLDIEGAYQEKREYNAQRADHTHEARALAGGKKF